MNDLKVALVQANQLWEDKVGNFKHIESLLEETHTDLILLPEMFHTGFSMEAEKLSEEWEKSEGIIFLKELARKKNAAVYTSLIISENNAFFNRGVFIEPNGKVVYYDKRKSFGLAGEDKVFTPGKEQVIHTYKGWKFLLQICYDLRFPEIQLNYQINDTPLYDVMLTVANWPERRNQHWKMLLPARAIENQIYVCAVNRVGTDKHELLYSGDSAVYDLLGNSLVQGSYTESVLQTTLSMDNLIETRKKLPFLKDRKI